MAATGAAIWTAASQSRVSGANERLSIGLIGCGARSFELQPAFQKFNGSLTAVCDVWRTRAEKAQAASPGAKIFDDHRKLLEMPGLDAVIIATSDHWHAAIAIDAANAGKDIYVEKPLTRTIDEGQRVVQAIRMNNRICQVGAQQRSGSHYIQARDEFVKAGKLGKIHMVRTWWNDGAARRTPATTNRAGGRATPPGMEMKPADLDWNRYIAPVNWRPWNPPQFFNFRNYIDLCGGILTDKYVHWVDVVHMFMDQQIPESTDTAGGLFVATDGRTVPDTLHLHATYPGKFVSTFTNVPQAGAPRDGIEFCGTDALLRINRAKFEIFPAGSLSPSQVVECKTDLVEEHVRNFLDCCKSRRMPNGDVSFGERSANAAHFGNLSLLELRRIHIDPEREVVLPL